MRLLWLTENYPPSRGGMSQSCDRLVRGLRQHNIQVDVIHFTARKAPFVTQTNVNGSYTACPRTEDVPHSLHLAFNFIESQVDVSDVDAIMIFGGLLPLSAAAVFSRLLALPYYVCLRGNDFDVSLFSYKRKDMLLEALEGAKAAFSVTQTKAERIQKLLPQLCSCYTPNGIDLDDWYALNSDNAFASAWRQEHVPVDCIVLGFFGALKTKKGVTQFIQMIKEARCEDKVYLLFSGDMEPALVAELETESIGYSRLPFLDRVELIQYYLACDWIVIPSFYDGMPNVLLEAGGLKVPVIASDVDGMADVIESQADGLLFSPYIKTDISRVLREVIAMPGSTRKAMGQALYDKVQRDYSVTTELTPYLTTFKEDGYAV